MNEIRCGIRISWVYCIPKVFWLSRNEKYLNSRGDVWMLERDPHIH